MHLIFLLFFLPAAVFANSQCETRYKVGVGTSWPPYVMYRDTVPYGLDIDITRRVFEKAQLCIDFVQLPSSARGITELSKGFIDILPSASFNTQRAEVAFFSQAYRRERMRLFTRKKTLKEVRSLTELFAAEHTFVANPGAYYGRELEQILKIAWYKERLLEVPSISQRMQLVNKKRVDFLIEDEFSGYYYIEELGFEQMRIHPYVVNDNAIHFMLSRKSFNKQQINEINAAIEALQSEIADLIDQYGIDAGTRGRSANLEAFYGV
ncbi:amino acid ABC transporter substrate-binding protein [Pseudoalteromonas rubra]|uniref:Amino acid ABC transporter substrate-binding protein n=1 Tax=Pseudoalteromonas rubra TaxID=43658 RepID=A0A4Q7ED81_9GAMM|nr:transporter substrate-binding domain-containing protein [Pseudoalteromonas rubra]RZM80693.1 amino acid ABC transporter substrate-binding protein [Pseudoalteromonas rubra]